MWKEEIRRKKNKNKRQMGVVAHNIVGFDKPTIERYSGINWTSTRTLSRNPVCFTYEAEL